MKHLVARLERAEEMAAQLMEACAVQEHRNHRAAAPDQQLLQALESLRAKLGQHDEATAASADLLHSLNAEHSTRSGRLVQIFDDFWQRVPALLSEEVDQRVARVHSDLQAQFARLDQERQDQFRAAVEAALAARTQNFTSALELHRTALAVLEDKSSATREHLSQLVETLSTLTNEVEKSQAPKPAAAPLPVPTSIDRPLLQSSVPATRPPRSRWVGTTLQRGAWATVSVLVVIIVAISGWQFAKGLTGENTTFAASDRVVPASLSQHPEKVLMEQAQQAMDTQDFATAEKFYREAVRVAPRSDDAIRGLSQTLSREGKLAQAGAVLKLLPANERSLQTPGPEGR
jgi:hypothetical protein